MNRALSTLFLLSAGCGSPQSDAGLHPAHEEPRDPEEQSSPALLDLPSGRPFASSPITETAEALTDLALAAVEGRALPTPPLPTDEPLESTAELELRVEPPPRLSVIAVAFEMDLVMKRGEAPAEAVGIERWGTLRATVALGRNGLRLVELRPSELTPDAGHRLPPGLEGMAAIARELLGHLRAGDLSAYELTAEDQRLLANDAIWARVMHDRPGRARIREVQQMLADLPNEPLGYRLDDISILARDAQNRLFALSLELDPANGSFALTTSPLVTVRLLWPPEGYPESLEQPP
jgi:hypothetical protein